MIKSSIQYSIIRSDVLHRYDHPTAEMIYFSVHGKHPRISLATVYRNLENLTKEGVVHKFMIPGEPDHYDAITHEHAHTHCENCGKIYDINIQLANALRQKVEKSGKIRMNNYQLIVSGMCRECENKKGEI